MHSTWLLGLCLAVAVAAKKGAENVNVPQPSAAPLFIDVCLFRGSFTWLYWVCLSGYCYVVCRMVYKGTPQVRYAHGFALSVLQSYGGSTFAAILCGNPVVFAVNQSLVTVSFLVWTAMYYMPKPMLALLDSNAGAVLLSMTFEAMRCHVMINCANMAVATLSPLVSAAYPVPFVGPLIAGLLGGCGSAFMPLDKGLKPVEKETAWRVQSGVIGSIWLQLAAIDPYTKPYVVGLFPLLADIAAVRACAVLFFVLTPLVGFVLPGSLPFGANPLLPAPQKKQKSN